MIDTYLQDILTYATSMHLLELSGLISGLLCVYFLIKESIWTWIWGILYVLISFIIFAQAHLYGDVLLHIVFLILNIYGWYTWLRGDRSSETGKMAVTKLSGRQHLFTFLSCVAGIVIFAQILIFGPKLIGGMPDAALPYWDSTTSILSVAGIWLTTIKKIENWFYWIVVDILATGIYAYKDLYFYSLLYFIYIFLAIAGYRAWSQHLDIEREKLTS